MISSSDKAVPTETLDVERQENIVCAAFRGHVAVSRLKQKLLDLAPQYWDESFHKQNNVAIQRPFHDKLGVNKIVCIFSDTDLNHLYQFPAWNDWKDDLVPIIQAAGAEPSQVVRLLFAKLPAHVKIPAHHDNGSWVSRTHRIHVAIRTDAKVDFRSGVVEDKMQRYAFNQGDIIELNNAAKHSVDNRSEIDRIHLIFDFIQQEFPKDAIILEPGQRCRQIRGRIELVDSEMDQNDSMDQQIAQEKLKQLVQLTDSKEKFLQACRHFFIEQINVEQFVEIFTSVFRKHSYQAQRLCLEMYHHVDLEMEKALRRELGPSSCPAFIIIGAQKSGTTSLYDYISQHPNARRGKRREPHFFDWAWQGALDYEMSRDQINDCSRVLESYHCSIDEMRMKYLLSLGYPSLNEVRYPIVCGESTPSYLLYGTPVAKRIHDMYPSIRLIVILRDPVSRAYSQYCMTADSVGTAQQLKARKAVAGKSFEQVVDFDLKLLETVDDATSFQRYVDELPQSHGCHSYVGRGLYVYQLELWTRVFPREQILILKLDSMRTSQGIQSTMDQTCAFLGLPEFILPDTERKNTRSYPPIDPKVQTRLETFYAPFNRMLKLQFGVAFD